jgi:hypothetical protein
VKVIYTAGPYRGPGWNDVWNNIISARAAARTLWLKGWAVICPHSNSIFMDGPEIPAMTFLNGDLEIIRRVDAVVMLPGWEWSEGSLGELELAKELGIPIYYSIQEVPDGRN